MNVSVVDWEIVNKGVNEVRVGRDERQPGICPP